MLIIVNGFLNNVTAGVVGVGGTDDVDAIESLGIHLRSSQILEVRPFSTG